MPNPHFQVELQNHNGVYGEQRRVDPYIGTILSLAECDIKDDGQPPIHALVRHGLRLFTYAYTVDFDTNGFYVFRESVR